MKARELKEKYSENRNLVTVTPETPLGTAMKKMKEHKIHHLVIMKDRKFFGILSSRDIVEYSQGSDWLGSSFPSTVGHAMKTHITPITEETDVKTALSLMLKNGSTGLPLSRNGLIVGVITETDLLKVLDMTLNKPGGFTNVVAAGEAALAHPVTQKFVKALGDAGI